MFDWVLDTHLQNTALFLISFHTNLKIESNSKGKLLGTKQNAEVLKRRVIL